MASEKPEKDVPAMNEFLANLAALFGKQGFRDRLRTWFGQQASSFAKAEPDHWKVICWSWNNGSGFQTIILASLNTAISAIQTFIKGWTDKLGLLGFTAEEVSEAALEEIPDTLRDMLTDAHKHLTYPDRFNPTPDEVRAAMSAFVGHLRLQLPTLTLVTDKMDVQKWFVATHVKFAAAVNCLDAQGSQHELLRYLKTSEERRNNFYRVLWAFDSVGELEKFLLLPSDEDRDQKVAMHRRSAEQWKFQLRETLTEVGQAFNTHIRPTLERQTRELREAADEIEAGMHGEFRRTPQREFNLPLWVPFVIGASILVAVLTTTLIFEHRLQAVHGSFVTNWMSADTTATVTKVVPVPRAKRHWYSPSTVTIKVPAPRAKTLPLPDSTFFGK